MLRDRSSYSLLRSTPLRLALTFAVLLFTAFGLACAIIYAAISVDLRQGLDEAVRGTYAVVADAYQAGDMEDLVAAVQSHARLVQPDDQLFSLVGPDGKLLAGTPLPSSGVDYVHTISLEPSGADYRALSGDVGGNRLTVAFATADLDETLGNILTAFVWSGVAVVILAIGGGVVLARRVGRRLDAIATVMNAVSHGQLSARIPLIGNGDDIDALSSRVNAALERLSDLVDSVRQVSTDIAHELKTPLNRLHLMVERAASRPGSPTAELDDALNEIAQLNATFEALLRVAQIESGSGKARFGDVDLASIVNNVADIYADVAADSGRMLIALGPSSGLPVLGDKDLLTQLVANLIENALRHTQAGSRITISISELPGQFQLVVADDGPGIPEEERDKVLRRLYRLDKSRSTPGSGLGLSIVSAIAGLHEARLSLEDNRPGLRVVVIFPALR